MRSAAEWRPDPFGRFEQRHFFLGRPTSLVRDGDVESFDEVGLLLGHPPVAAPAAPSADLGAMPATVVPSVEPPPLPGPLPGPGPSEPPAMSVDSQPPAGSVAPAPPSVVVEPGANGNGLVDKPQANGNGAAPNGAGPGLKASVVVDPTPAGDIPVTGQTLPGQTLPGQTLPGQTLPGQTLPGQTLPGQTLPGQTLPGQTLPGQTLPGQALPAVPFFPSMPPTPVATAQALHDLENPTKPEKLAAAPLRWRSCRRRRWQRTRGGGGGNGRAGGGGGNGRAGGDTGRSPPHRRSRWASWWG